MIRIDLIRLNEILDKLAQNKFFENYAELKDFYNIWPVDITSI